MFSPIDTDARVSEELSFVLEALLNDPMTEEPVTLGVARDRVQRLIEDTLHSPDRRIGSEQSVMAELEALIEEYGADVPADDFVAVTASEELSEVIAALLDRADEDAALTLASVREAIDSGLVAQLQGRGVIEADDVPALRAELETLIERYGSETPAESLLRLD